MKITSQISNFFRGFFQKKLAIGSLLVILLIVNGAYLLSLILLNTRITADDKAWVILVAILYNVAIIALWIMRAGKASRIPPHPSVAEAHGIKLGHGGKVMTQKEKKKARKKG